MIKVVLCMGCRFGIYGKMFATGVDQGITKFVEAGSYLERCSFKVDLIKDKGGGSYKEGLLSMFKNHPEYDREFIEIDHENWKIPRLFEPKGFLGYDSIECFNFFHYFENNPNKTEEHVKQKCSWKKPSRGWHFDCKVESIKDLLYLSLLGYTENDCKLSAMIRYGLIKRPEALDKLNSINSGIMSSKERTLSFMENIGLGQATRSFAGIII
jgi:hypothetical protein